MPPLIADIAPTDSPVTASPIVDPSVPVVICSECEGKGSCLLFGEYINIGGVPSGGVRRVTCTVCQGLKAIPLSYDRQRRFGLMLRVERAKRWQSIMNAAKAEGMDPRVRQKIEAGKWGDFAGSSPALPCLPEPYATRFAEFLSMEESRYDADCG